MFLSAVFVFISAAAQPALTYEPPAGWKRGPYSHPVVFTAPAGDAEIHVYPFQRYDGDVRARLRETRLFELIAIEHRENGSFEQPKTGEITVEGAGPVPYAIFGARHGARARLHFCAAIPAPGAVALVDYQAFSDEAWKREIATVDRFFGSMRIGTAPAAAATPAKAQGASGLYLATVRRMVIRPTGGTDWTTSTEFYLLSADGKAYRGHGLPEVPGGDLRRFDYEKARRADPGNSGTWAGSGGRVRLVFGEERIDAALAADELEVRGTKFRRSVK